MECTSRSSASRKSAMSVSREVQESAPSGPGAAASSSARRASRSEMDRTNESVSVQGDGAMEGRFGSLRGEDRLERTLRAIRERERESKEEQERNFEQERRREAERRRKVEKRRQDERRRTQEIISIVSQPNHPSAGINNNNNDISYNKLAS